MFKLMFKFKKLYNFFILLELWVVKYLLIVIMCIFLLDSVFKYIGIVVVKVFFLFVFILGMFLL